jgi:hypothetical protein
MKMMKNGVAKVTLRGDARESRDLSVLIARCGRALNAPHRTSKSRLKPPEPDPPQSGKITEI